MEYVSKDFSSTQHLKLIASANSSHFSLVYLDQDDNLVKYVHEIGHPWINDTNPSVHNLKKQIVLVDTPFTLVPSSEFSLEVKKRIAQQAFPLESIDHVHHFIHNGLAGVYIIDNELDSLLKKHYPNFIIQHVFEKLWLKQVDIDPSIQAHWTLDGIIIVVIKDGLRMANYYKIKTPEDAIYYLLSAYQHGQMDPLEQPLRMSGRISKESVLFEKVAGFIRHFDWMNASLNQGAEFPFEPHLLHHLT